MEQNKGINIWSGSNVYLGAALTNPTELSFKKGKIKNHYPIFFRGKEYIDAELAFKSFKTNDLDKDMQLMTEIINCKLKQYPKMIDAIKRNGGLKWLETCHHIVGVTNSRWEGTGRNSNFILCLINAFELVEKQSTEIN